MPFISGLGFPGSVVAGSRGRPLGSHYGKQPQGDRQEGDSGNIKPSPSLERR